MRLFSWISKRKVEEEKMPKDYLGYYLFTNEKRGYIFSINFINRKKKRIYRVMELKCDEPISKDDIIRLAQTFEMTNLTINKNMERTSCDTSLIDNKWSMSYNKGYVLNGKFKKQGKQIWDKSISLSFKEFAKLIPEGDLKKLEEILERINITDYNFTKKLPFSI
jgi:hypothetical protein